MVVSKKVSYLKYGVGLVVMTSYKTGFWHQQEQLRRRIFKKTGLSYAYPIGSGDSKKLAPSLSQKEGPQHMLSKPMWHQPPMKQITQSGREVRSHYGVGAVFGAA